MLTQHFLKMRDSQNQMEALFLSSLGGLSMQQLKVLNVIGDNPASTMSKIADKASLSLSSITLIVDKLVKAKLAERIRSEDDRRVVYMKLADEGEKIYQSQIDFMQTISEQVLKTLSDEEQDTFVRILGKVVMS